MSEFYNRDFSLTIGSQTMNMQLVDEFQQAVAEPILKVDFNVEKSLDKDPNVANVTIYNLNLDNRATLQEGSEIAEKLRKGKKVYDWPIVIEAGYVGFKEVLFKGNITFVNSVRETVNWVTYIEAGDAEKKTRSKRLNKSFAKGTTVFSVIDQVAEVLGVGKGNLQERLGSGVFRKGYGVFKQGFVASGRVVNILDGLLASAGYTWSIQDGELQILAPADTVLEEVIVLTKDSGLIGSPEKGEKGRIVAKSLLQGRLNPGRRVIIESEMIDGTYKIERVNHYGDVEENDWYSEFEAKPA